MNASANAPETREIVVEELLPHSPETIWKALTRGELIERWLMPTDFEPVPGKHFTFRTRPIGAWDGVVKCEVLEVRPFEKLVYSWKGGSDENGAYGGRLDSTVTWTLSAVEGGTLLRLVHAGFRSPQNDFALEAMRGGWAKVAQRIESVVATL